MGQTWAVVNQKGGVGKTTCTINLAAELAAAGQRVLVADVDPQGNATSGLGVGWACGDEGSCAVYSGAWTGASVEPLCRPAAGARLQVLPAGPDLTAVQMAEGVGRAAMGRLREALAGARQAYDVVLIDCPPSLGLLTLGALCAADAVLVPSTCDYFALEGLSQLSRTLAVVRETHHPELAVGGIVLTLYDPRSRLARAVADQIQAHFGARVFAQRIPRNVRLSEAPSHGLPVGAWAPTSSGAQAYRRLAREFLARLRPAVGVARPRRAARASAVGQPSAS